MTLTNATYQDRTCELSFGVRVEVKWSEGMAYFVCRRAGFSISVLLLSDMDLYYFREVDAMWIVPSSEGCFSVQATEHEAQRLAHALKRRLRVHGDMDQVSNPGLRNVFEKARKAGHLWRQDPDLQAFLAGGKPPAPVKTCDRCSPQRG